MSEEATIEPCPCCQQKASLEKRQGMQRVTSGAWYRERAYCRNKKCGMTTAVFNKPGQAITAWNTRIAATRPNADGLVEALEHKLWMVASHATGGQLGGLPMDEVCAMSANQISVRISAFRNTLWEEAKKSALSAFQQETDRG